MKNFSENSKLPNQPEETSKMDKEPITYERTANFMGSDLKGKSAVITGGDSGIGQAIAILYANFGINSIIVYFDEHADAQSTIDKVHALGASCKALQGDIRDINFCREIISTAIDSYGRIDILINNASVQYPQSKLEDISQEQLIQTFEVNVFGMFYLTQAALKYMKKGSSIINTTSITAFRGSKDLVDYSSTKGAILAFTRSLAMQLVDKGIRVNAVAPGPIMTPLIPASFDAYHVKQFGKDTPIGRPGQPYEVAPSYLFLILEENSYMTGQVLHPNGGEIVA